MHQSLNNDQIAKYYIKLELLGFFFSVFTVLKDRNFLYPLPLLLKVSAAQSVNNSFPPHSTVLIAEADGESISLGVVFL